MFRISIDPSVLALEPGFQRTVVGVRLPALSDSLHRFEPELRQAESGCRDLHDAKAIASHPHLLAWRAAFRKFGANPSQFRPSVDALIRRVANGSFLPSIHPLVDLGTILSLRFVLPVGVHPIADKQTLVLRTATEGDIFQPPTGDPEHPATGEVVFATGSEVHARRWVWRQSRDSMVQASTQAVEFNLDALPPVGRAELERARGKLVELLSRLPDSRTDWAHLDARNPSATIAL